MKVNSIYMIIVFLIIVGCNVKNMHDPTMVELVVITDLYHPYHDPTDNFELINAFALPNIDLKAVIIDCYNPYRKKIAKGLSRGLFDDPNGPREPGYICMHQLNYIFGRNVPFGVGPFETMQSKNDKMEYLTDFYNQGLDLLKKTLEDTKEPITVASFGSARVLAVAYNRFPELMKNKIKMIHLSAGTSSNDPYYLEWNVALDTIAFVNLIESGLPISLYPCAAGQSKGKQYDLSNAFMADSNNTYYTLNSLSFIEDMNPKLRQYCYSIYSRYQNVDYLDYLDRNDQSDSSIYNRSQHVWESAIWMNITNLKLIKSKSGEIKIIPNESVKKDDKVFDEQLIRCTIDIAPSGIFEYKYDNQGKFFIYKREDPERYQDWMNIAIPYFYKSLFTN